MILKLILYAIVSYFYLFLLLSNHSIILAKRSSKIVPFFGLTKEDLKPINMTFNDTDTDDDDDDDNDNKDDKPEQIDEKKTSELPKIDRSKVVEGKDAYPSYKKMGYGAWVANNQAKLNALITRHRRHWVYFYKPNQVILENVNKPDYYANTYETFPARLTSILATNNVSDYYFFNRKKYCRRAYDIRDNSQGSCPDGWKPNYDLFGCSKADANPKLKTLCKNPDIDGSFIMKETTYVTRKSKYWMFGQKLTETESNHFNDFKDGDKDANKTWPGYLEESDGVFIYNSKLTQVYNSRWYQWSEKGDRSPYFPIREKPVKNLPIPKTFDRYQSVMTITVEKIVTIISTTVYYFSVKSNKATIIGKPVKYLDSPEHLPPNVTGSVKSPENQWYFFRDDRYCKRPFDASADKSLKAPDFCNWGQNKDLFKCDKFKNIPAMDMFCAEPFVDGAVVLRKEYLIFRSGRYWQYDGEPNSDTGPFGKLIDGALYSSDRFKNFDQNPGMFVINDKLIIFKRRKLYQTLTNGKASSSTTINEAEQVDSKINLYGTPVVYTEETEIKISLITTTSAWIYKLAGNKMYKTNGGLPEPLSKSKYKFPTKLNAALYESKSKVYYFIRLNKFCKRTLNPQDSQTDDFIKNYAMNEVDENGDKMLVKGKPKAEDQEKDTMCNWFDIGHLYGCNNQRKSSALIDLCNNPIPSGAAILNKKIYIFRETSYYVFNGHSNQYSVFGKLIEGPTEAAQKFKAFDPSNGGIFSYNELLYSIFERVQWSRWFADGRRDLYDQTIVNEGTSPSDKVSSTTPKPNKDVDASTERASNAKISTEKPSKPSNEKPSTDDVTESKDMTNNQRKTMAMVHISGTEYALIKETTVRYYKKRSNNWYPDGDAMDVDKSRHRFPAGVTAVQGKNRDNTYVFFKGQQHCKRKLFVILTFVCEFINNREILGCSSDNILDGLRLLCINPFITSAASVGSKNYLFREDKYWVFNPSKPGSGIFGEFESGPNPISNYPQMTTLSDVIFGAIDRLTMFTEKSFYSWFPDGKPDVVDSPRITDHEIYPSMRDENKLGSMVQTSTTDYVRIRGKYVFYYEKKAGQTYTLKQSRQYASTHETNEKFEEEMTAISKLNDDQYLFFKKGFVCKRSFTAKDYCEWISTDNLFNCHDSQTPEISELCNDPVIDGAMLTDSKNTLFLVKNNNLYSTVWEDTMSKFSLTTTRFMTKFIKNVDSVWSGFHPNPDALFRVDYGPERGNYVMFHNNRYTMWCTCKNQNMVVSQNVTIHETPFVEPNGKSVEQRKDSNSKPESTTTEDNSVDDPSDGNNKTVVYNEQVFIDFCNDPVFSAADSSTNGSQIYLFTKDRYYVLEELRFGVGKLVRYGSTRDWLKEFDVGDSNSVTTIKEGWERGYMYEFMPKSQYISWKPSPYFKLDHSKASYYALPKEGFWASLHNRDMNKPMLIGLEGENVHYFSTKNRVFSRVGPTIKYNKSPEKFPPNITAAFSMPNGYIYLFRNKRHCIRDWTYGGTGSYCPKWNDNRQFLGCYGQDSPPFSLERSIPSPIDRLLDDSAANSDVNYKILLCENLEISDGDAVVDTENSIMVWRGDKYWRIDNFPENPIVSFSGQTSVNWPGFLPNPDAVTFVHESSDRRGYLYAFHGADWSTWRPDLTMMTVKKAWGQPDPSNKFGAVLHTRDVNSQMAIGFDRNMVHYYSTEMSNFVLKKKVSCDDSEEKWPSDVSAAWKVNDDVYLFRGDKYCVRKMRCNESVTNCCDAWLEAKDLFNCDEVKGMEEVKESSKDKELQNTQEKIQLDISRLRSLLSVSDNENEEENDYLKLYQLLNEVYYMYEIIDTKGQLIQGPIPVKYSPQYIPSAVTAAVRFNNSYLFFKADKYCKRSLELPKLRKLSECPFGYRESSLLFECEKSVTDEHKALCKDLSIDGAVIVENQFIVLRKSLYWIFNLSESDRLVYESGGLDTRTRFSGFREDNDGITSVGSNKEGKVVMFYKDRWWKWYRNGSTEIDGSVIDKYIDIDTDHSLQKKKEKLIVPVFMSQDIDETNGNSSLSEIHYPSEKEAKVYGAIVQLDYGPNPKFARLRGNEVYYFTKLSDIIQFNGEAVNISDTKEKFPPDVSAVFRGPDQTYYFIREEQYCRRPLDVSALNLDPPDYCPEGGDLLDLFGCTRHQYISAIDKLCQNPRIDNAISTADGKYVYVFHNDIYWILSGLPTNIRHAPTNSFITYGGKQSETWLNSDTNYDAFFLLQSDSFNEKVVEFHRSRYRVWSAIGGLPEEEGDIVENETTVNSTKAIPFISVIDNKPTPNEDDRKIVYTDEWHIKLCAEPKIDSADSNLNGSEVYLFKGDRYYVLTGLRKGVGKLGVTALTRDWLPEFDPNGTSFVTCKEGYRRSNLYQWMPNRKWSAWDRTGKLWGNRQNWDQQAITGFSATLHNRNASEPLMIGLDGDLVHYYSTSDWWFTHKTRVMSYNDTPEKFPPGVEAAFSMPDGFIYLFRGNQFCVRQWTHVPPPLYCPLWQDSRVLFGCFGPYKDIRRSITTQRIPAIDREALYDLCHDPNIDDGDRLWQRDNELYVWRGARYWHVIGFPKTPRVIAAGPSLQKWPQFSENPDAVVMIQEGTIRRGCIVAFYGGYWSAWFASNKPWVGSKAWWAQPNPSMKFGATMHNGDIDNPQVLGFDGNYVHYYNTEGSNLYFKEKLKLAETSEVWPENITAAWRMEDNTVYLFRGDRYCKRNWNCNDSSTNCCYQWIDARFLFGCEAKLEDYEER